MEIGMRGKASGDIKKIIKWLQNLKYKKKWKSILFRCQSDIKKGGRGKGTGKGMRYGFVLVLGVDTFHRKNTEFLTRQMF